jgi:hypothetical protein
MCGTRLWNALLIGDLRILSSQLLGLMPLDTISTQKDLEVRQLPLSFQSGKGDPQ